MADIGLSAQDSQRWNIMNGKLDGRLLRGIDLMGFEFLSSVQHKVLTQLPTFRSDCLVQAKTGTGKTLAFLLPAIQSLLTLPPLPRGQVAILALSPTRELALQIAKECDALTSQLTPRLECHTAYGGTSKDRELKRFTTGDPKIVVATPGRLNDYLSDEAVSRKFGSLRTLVLDEADAMLDAGFLVAINEILRRLPPKSKGWQGMCFSATVPQKIEAVLPKVLKPDCTRLSTIDPDEAPTIDRVPQHSVVVPTNRDVFTTLHALLQKEFELSPNDFKVIVFGATANGVALMAALLTNLYINSPLQIFQLQSRLSQNIRTRTTNEFKEASAGVMVASDVIGRGMDFPNVGLVVQVGLPANGDQYIHRVGRTARAGNEGRAVILLTERESFFLKANKHLPITPYSPDLSSAAKAQSSDVESAFEDVEDNVKAKAYQAWLGFHKTSTKQLRLTNDGLVEQANEYAATVGCPEPPMIDKRVVGKMGLKGVKGLNVGLVEAGGGGRVTATRNSAGRVAKTASESDRGRGGGRGGGRGRGRGRGGGGRGNKV
ncbi:hypothetical protein LTR37_015247 [Vermiconidia calcicola]|uniref:Uncharacterized protein n=1 Tax=Vermiconidia calcicola TaxID=1690605 RepID=A0ACC3MRC1_9PEZI|nr:hypothetical protein LTR37_015247 [Vermiconidia calcicola]